MAICLRSSARQALCILSVAVMLGSPVFAQGYDRDYFESQNILYYNPDACTPTGYAERSIEDNPGEISGSDVPSDFSLGSDDSMRPINLARQLMLDFNFTDYQAAGIVGNFMQESGLNLAPNINEGKPPILGPPRFKGGYGWAQWTGPRQITFVDYAINNGFMSSRSDQANDAANYAYLKYEITATSEKVAVGAVLATETVEQATAQWEKAFERAGKPVLNKRIAYAKAVLTAMQNGKGVDVSEIGSTTEVDTDTGDISCEPGNTGPVIDSVTFDSVVFPLRVNKGDIKNRSIFANGTTSSGYHSSVYSGYKAIDIYAAAGTEVVAFTGGVVRSVRPTGSMGGSITVYTESKGIHVYYTHLMPLSNVKVGDTVSPGTLMAKLVSVRQYPAINTDHLHIDAGPGATRGSCSASKGIGGPACHDRIDIGPDLYSAYQKLPE